MSRSTKRKVSYVYDSDESEFVEDEPIKKVAKKRTKINENTGTLDAFFGGADPSNQSHSASRHIIKDPAALRRPLLSWYDGVSEKRGMPWRKTFDASLDRSAKSQRAYEVWISEIMLQQTQVATVIPYYNRWMERFPTIASLAESEIETVNGLWKGLGYYSRAARLLGGAQKVVNEYGGIFPESAKEMIANIPGIGRYSAGAISSIAYGHCEPVLDGNVNRLLSRVLALHANPKAKPTLDVLWDGALAMIKKSDRPGDINQAMIELGSTVCKVRDPTCKECPLNQHCVAYVESKNKVSVVKDIEDLCDLCEPVLPDEDKGVTRYPMKVERKKAREETDLVNVIERCSADNERHFLLARRPETGLLAGLHEFPTLSDVKDCSTAKSARKLGEEMVQDLLRTTEADTKDVKISKATLAGDVLHVFSHIRKMYRVQWVLLEGGDEPPSLNGSYMSANVSKSKKTPKSSKKVQGSLTTDSDLRWVAYEDVASSNVGTGVMKVWKKVCEFWED